jgi:hypothetical protein
MHFEVERTLTFGASAFQNRPRTVVLVRAHFVSDKLLDLVRMLKEGVGYDLWVCADETQGPLNLPRELVLSHNTEMCARIGLVPSLPDSPLLWYFGDYAFYCAHHSIPDYDYYVMIEYDVEFVRGNVYALESLLRRLSFPTGNPYDLVATHYGPRAQDWGWGETCVDRFKDYYGLFFPMVVLSKRALQYLYDWRKYEAANPPESGRYAFCEAFVPSALMAAGGHRCVDLNALLPGSWDRDSFRTRPPMLMGGLPPLTRGIELVHPVYSEREYLQSELNDAWHEGTLARLVSRLSDPTLLPVSQESREDFLGQISALNGSAAVPHSRRRRSAKARATEPGL